MDRACSPNRERVATGATIEHCAWWIRDTRANSWPMSRPLETRSSRSYAGHRSWEKWTDRAEGCSAATRVYCRGYYPDGWLPWLRQPVPVFAGQVRIVLLSSWPGKPDAYVASLISCPYSTLHPYHSSAEHVRIGQRWFQTRPGRDGCGSLQDACRQCRVLTIPGL